MSHLVVGPEHFEVVIAEGPDATKLLQGQLTCDLLALGEMGATFGACCNNKGRMLAAFYLVKIHGVFYFCCKRGVGTALVTALKKFLPFYKCHVRFTTPDEGLYALAETAVSTQRTTLALTEQANRLTPTAQGWFAPLAGTPARAFYFSAALPKDALSSSTATAVTAWEALELLNGHYPFTSNEVEHFTPQDLHYDKLGYVSFSKGCYTGQEIVARMHYRGKPKKQLYLLSWPAGQAVDKSTVPTLRTSTGYEFTPMLMRPALGMQLLAVAELPIDLASTEVTINDQQGTQVSWRLLTP